MVERACVEPLDEVLEVGRCDGRKMEVVVVGRRLEMVGGRGVAEGVTWVVCGGKEGGGCQEYFEVDGKRVRLRARCNRYWGAEEVSVLLALVNWQRAKSTGEGHLPCGCCRCWKADGRSNRYRLDNSKRCFGSRCLFLKICFRSGDS